MAFLWGLLRTQTNQTGNTLAPPHQAKQSQAIPHAFKLGLWSHKINCDYRLVHSTVFRFGVAFAGDTHTIKRIRARSRRLSRKNDKNNNKNKNTKNTRPIYWNRSALPTGLCVYAEPTTIESMSRWTKLHIMNGMMARDAHTRKPYSVLRLMRQEQMRANQVNALFLFFFTAPVYGRVCERPFMLCFMFAALVFNRLRAENCDDDDDERGNVEMMLIKISVIFYDYFYYTFFAFVRVRVARLPMKQRKLVQQWLDECNKMDFDLISFNSPCDCLHWVIWTCCIQRCDHGRVARFTRFTRACVGLVKLKTVNRIRPCLDRSFLLKRKRMSFTIECSGEILSPFVASFSIRGWNCPRRKPTLVLSAHVP